MGSLLSTRPSLEHCQLPAQTTRRGNWTLHTGFGPIQQSVFGHELLFEGTCYSANCHCQHAPRNHKDRPWHCPIRGTPKTHFQIPVRDATSLNKKPTEAGIAHNFTEPTGGPRFSWGSRLLGPSWGRHPSSLDPKDVALLDRTVGLEELGY